MKNKIRKNVMDDIYVNFLFNVYGFIGISCILCGNIL